MPQSAVCNGIVDCRDGSDEAACNVWTRIESDNIFKLTSDAQVLSSRVFADCRAAARRNGTSLFALSRNQSVCILYSSRRAQGYLQDPSSYIVSTPNFVMFAMLPNGVAYGRCSSESSCNGNGQVVSSRSGGKLSCTCVCNTGFTGSDCSTRMALGSEGPVVVSFSSVDLLDITPTPSRVEAALALLANSSDTSVSCSPLVNQNGKLLAACTVTGPAAEVSAINAAVTNEVAREKVAQALNISTRNLDPMTASTQPLFQKASCGASSATGGGNDVSCAAGGKPIQRIKAAVTASTGVGEIVLNLGRNQQQRHFASASAASILKCVPDNNNLYETPTRSGCVTTVCFVSISNPAPVDAVTVSTPRYSGNASTDPCYSVGLEFTVPLLISDVVKAFPAKASDNFSSFLISGIVILVVGGLMLGAASCALRLHIAESARAVGTVDTDHRLKSILTTAIRKMRFNQRRNLRAERWSTAFAIASFDLIVLGIFLALYFVHSSGYTSNVEVLLENYRTSQCELSTFASLASRVTIIPASTSHGCILRENTGIAGGSIYAAAYCDNSTGILKIQLKIGSSLGDCNAMPFTAYEAGACVRTSQLLSHVNDSSYMLFQCGTTHSVKARFAAFQALNADTPDLDVTRPQPPSSSIAQPTNRLIREGSRSYFVSTRVSQAAAMNVTSSAWNRYESAAEGRALVAGDSSPQRLVVQLDSDVFDPDTLADATSLVEAAFPLKSVDVAVAALGPLDGDYPAGFLFNNYKLPGEASRLDAGPGAARYYGIRGSAADVGQHYHGGRRNGFTITMYLRCSRSTAGFAFAVADAREDMVTRMSPLLVRLMTMLANGSPGSKWYNSTYNVYTGLYVDGPAAALRFVYANPSDASPDSALIDLRWDLTTLGLLRLFNNAWHHVAIIIRTENEDTKVQLVVDGVTSASQNGWNLCPERTPEPVQQLDPTVDVAVRNFQVERVLTDGVLFTGYFNGGVAHLEFRNERVELFELWRSSTRVIQAHNAINTSQYIALGFVLIAVGIAMLGMMLVTSGSEWILTQEQSRQDEERRAHEVYDGLWRKAPRDPSGNPYRPLAWELAIACMGADVKTFAVFLDELKFNFRHPPEELVRLLFAKSTAGSGSVNPTIAAPTAEEWNFLVDPLQNDGLGISSGSLATEQSDDTDARQLHRVDTNASLPDCDDEMVSPMTSFRGKSERSQGRIQVKWSHEQSNTAVDMTSIVCNDPQQQQLQQQPQRSRKVEEKKKIHVQVGKEDMKMSKGKIPAPFKGRNMQHGGGAKGTKAKDGGSKQNATKRGGGREVVTSASASELVQSVLTVIQSVSVWQTSLPFPAAHLAAFQTAFATFSLDLTALVSTSPLVTPLVQLFVGLVVFGVLLFVVESDEKAFLWNLARYTVVRDSIDLGVPQDEIRHRVDGDYMSEVTADFDSLLGEIPDNGLHYTVPLLPLHQAQKIDDFVSGDKRRALAVARAVMIHDNLQRSITLQKPPAARDNCPIAYLNVKSTDAVTTPLRILGHCCALHINRALGPQMQTNVWPYKFRPTCCVETHGQRCGESVGKMFVCGQHGESRDGELVQCKYAVCEKHFRAPLRIKLVNPIVGLYRAAMDRGFLWFIVTIFLILANACYTPFMKTALMILACDPYYQCQFQHCWEAPDRLFVLGAYLCLVIVTFYGVGFPLSMAVLLHRRRQMLGEIFFSDVYGGRFEEDTSAPRGGRKTVDKTEWGRFVVTDPTALGKLYLSFELNWIYVPPILLFWKAAILTPAVFIERDTFQQLAGVASAQFLFGLFLFVTEPSISPVVDLMYKLGAAHQMLLLGVLSLNTRQMYAGSTDLGPVTVSITATYLVVCFGILVGITLVPVLKKSLDQRRVVQLFDSLGMHYSNAISMYVVPYRQPLFSELASVPYGEPKHSSAASEAVLDQSLVASSSSQQPENKIGQDEQLPFARSRRAGSTVNLLGVQREDMAAAHASFDEEDSPPESEDAFIDGDATDPNNPYGADDVLSEDDIEDEVVRPIVLSDEIIQGLVKMTKSDSLTPFQRRILFAAESGKDCFVAAPAGYGKSTAAIITALRSVKQGLDTVQVVVMCSGANEAVSFAERATCLGSHMNGGQPFVKLFDGTNRAAVDIQELQSKPHEAKIIVGTARSLTRLVVRSALTLFHTAHVIIHDAEATLGRGACDDEDDDETNADRVHRLLRMRPAKSRMTMLASSPDVPEEVRVTAFMFMKQIVEITAPPLVGGDMRPRRSNNDKKPAPVTPRDVRLKTHQPSDVETTTTVDATQTLKRGDTSRSTNIGHITAPPTGDADPGMSRAVASSKSDIGASSAAQQEPDHGELRRASSVHHHVAHVTDLDVDFEVPE